MFDSLEFGQRGGIIEDLLELVLWQRQEPGELCCRHVLVAYSMDHKLADNRVERWLVLWPAIIIENSTSPGS